MPQYEYQCPHCRAITTQIKSMKKIEDAPTCEYCSENVETTRIMSAGMFKINGYSEANGYSNKG